LKNLRTLLSSLVVPILLSLIACNTLTPNQTTDLEPGETTTLSQEIQDPTQKLAGKILALSSASESPTAVMDLGEEDDLQDGENVPKMMLIGSGNNTPMDAGPDVEPEAVNPLTGQPVEDPTLLSLPPALVSISNFPASARPQAGLNVSPITYEIAIGEGMTRFLSIFYGDFPEAVDEEMDNPSNQNANPVSETAAIGPIRSGRLPYEDLRATYSGFLVMASAWKGVSQNLNSANSVYGSEDDDINSAMVTTEKLFDLAESQSETFAGSNFNLEGMRFSSTPPAGGKDADTIWVFYSALNQIQWQYDENLQAYIRYDIKTDGSGEFVMATDRLTGEPVAKENVIVLYAEHKYIAPTLIDIDLMNKPSTKALLFRNGKVYDIFWTSQFGDYEKETGRLRPIRFVDVSGEPIAQKPGQTWIQVVSMSSYHVESAPSEQPFYPVIEENETGLWLIRYRGKY